MSLKKNRLKLFENIEEVGVEFFQFAPRCQNQSGATHAAAAQIKSIFYLIAFHLKNGRGQSTYFKGEGG